MAWTRELAGGRAVREPALLHQVPRQALEREAVEHRLQDATTVHDGGQGRAVLPRLVIGDAHDRRARLALDEVDRTAQQETSVHACRLGDRRLVPVLVVRHAERQLEPLGHPGPAASDQLVVEPAIEVAGHRLDLVAPDALDGGGELVARVFGDPGDGPPQRAARGRQPGLVDRKLAVLLQHAQELGLDGVEQAAARQRIEVLQRRRLLQGREPVDRREQELVRTGREALQRGHRIGPHGETLRLQRRKGFRRHSDDPVRCVPSRLPPRPAFGDRAAQRLVELDQVPGPPLGSFAVAILQQRQEDGEIVLERVDGAIRVGGRRPCQRRAPFTRGKLRQVGVGRDAPGDGPHHVEHVERRHTRSRFADLDSRIRQMDTLARRANRQAQLQALVVGPCIGDRERGVQRLPAAVQQQGVLAQPLREHALGQARHEHHAEPAPARGGGRADKHRS